jgi:N-acetyl-anhydromuramyl-L-alanine amidase AmpD
MEIKFRPSPNYSTSAQKKIGAVLHFTLGSYAGAVEWLCNKNRPNLSSAHYIIGRNEGEITQIVKDGDVSWHAGNVYKPSERFTKVALKNLDGTYKNPNQYLIGIELAAGYDMGDANKTVDPEEYKITPWQYQALQELLTKFNFDPKYIFTHKDIASYKEDTDEVRTEVLRRMNATVVQSGNSTEEMVAVHVPKSKVDKVMAYLKTI